ncbi:cation:proton antiporter [Defluviimonas sp. 20V17]|uniref:Monovalent cation/H+ antiporter subunit A n=1 Tax=Allgaiera indica TaxID=765699 RepID=A0AAN4USV9_9RHOB|nr:monovalent cation/H+ antiporter subunit A [Allgaiera indica]KDB01922.1 cation:proton antiporter [Defluviimonas sp. 20V17]GHE03425.1 monovalent cation/H+ antiporter subunit A [Allgaiera indica]SDX25396.1 multisubunit potassium/proton antiporter, PhaA subunit /multisubunit potassium/proton antiporter, PhaB subunit [Allgaiera indica]
MPLSLIAALPFLGALFPALMARAGRNTCAGVTGAFTALALLGLLLHAPAVLAGHEIVQRIAWVPQIGLNANFFLDGLGFLFALLILGIGLLIILYARFYLDPKDSMGEFYTYLLLFQGAMVGIVLSDNILLLLVFWELTSLSSFLLIGFWKHLAEGRQGARMALAVTGMGGLAMIAGMLILGHVAGSYDISEILKHREEIQASPLFLPAMLLILTGAFAKSAQFPFHFWLPHAMAAPTPVSAYLHSATMVKAGLFLMARLWPIFAGRPEWFYIVSTVGLLTMVMAAKIALFKDDLKALLAFSTVSHLGLITFLLGLGTKAGVIAAVFHIINHATFKAALFMTAGIVDHETHTRDAKRLGGLMTLMPITFTIATIAGLSMAGIPPFNGFISKEMMLEAAAHTYWLGNPWILGVVATLGAIFSVAYSLRYIAHVFLGPVREDYPSKPHDPVFGMWASPGVLAALVIAIGLFPMTVAGWIVTAAANAVTGSAVHPELALWHGITPALWMSIIAISGGALLVGLHGPLERLWLATPKPEAKRIFDALMAAATGAARGVTEGLHNGAISRYLTIFSVTCILAGVYAYAGGSVSAGHHALTPLEPVPLIAWFALMAATVAVVMYHHNRLLSLVLVGIIGLMVSIAFVYLSAPDLALTQISVEVVTVMLLLLALNFLPKTTPKESSAPRKWRDGIIAIAGGLGVGALIYALMIRDFAFKTISTYQMAHSKPDAGGENVVNVIIVDFRGYDTFGEITVLGIAAIAIYALTDALLRGPANARLRGWVPDLKRAGDRHPLMLVVATRVMMPIAVLVGIFIYLRGHNEPGGGFVAGLVIAIALLMQYMASGFAWAHLRQRFNYQALIGLGVLAAAVTGIGAFFNGRPFLTSDFGHFYIPYLGEFELATAMGFDLGVFLTVVGAVMLALASLSLIARRAGETVNRAPMSTDPREDAPEATPENKPGTDVAPDGDGPPPAPEGR